jgi:curved DNA-binding protein CbpA
MKAQLSEHPLAELISEIAAKKLSGALRVERERVKAAIYFEAGELTYATTNLRNYRLAEYFIKHTLASPEQISQTMDPGSDFALAATLLANGVVNQPSLDNVINEQVADVLRLVLLWLDGEWEFDSRARLNEQPGVAVPIGQLLLESARRMDVEFTASRFPNGHESVSPVPVPPNGIGLSSSEGFMLSRLEAATELGDLAALSGQSEPDALRTIYGLVLAGFLQREFWQPAFKSGPPRSIKPDATKASVPKEAPAPRPPLPERDAKEELNEFLERVSRATNHYEVLDVPTFAEVSEIRHAYHALARRFHPDRFHDLAGTTTHARLESVFARITQANETLTNRDVRANYDAKVAALKTRTGAQAKGGTGDGRTESGVPENILAEKEFQKGVAALNSSLVNEGISALAEAVRLAPHQARYRAYYGRALASQQRTRRLAEVELQAAIKLDASNGSYRVMLAALYRDLGFTRRAVSELERALALDSQNREAREMLRTIESKKT